MPKSTFVESVEPGEESLYVNRSSKQANANLKYWLVKDNDFIVCLVPSLGLSGYGDTKDTAISMLKESLDDYFDNLFELKQDLIDATLSKHGWKKKFFSRKKFSAPFIDRKGILRQFDLPDDVEFEEKELQLSLTSSISFGISTTR